MSTFFSFSTKCIFVNEISIKCSIVSFFRCWRRACLEADGPSSIMRRHEWPNRNCLCAPHSSIKSCASGGGKQTSFLSDVSKCGGWRFSGRPLHMSPHTPEGPDARVFVCHSTVTLVSVLFKINTI